MKVILDARYLNAPDSGIGTYTENLLRQLLAVEPVNEYVVISRTVGLAARFDPDRCRDLVFDAAPRSRRTRHALGRVLNGHAYDVYHSTFNLLPTGLARPSVVTVHDVIPMMDPALVDARWSYRWTAGRFWRRGMSYAVTHASAVLTVSKTSAREIESRFGPEVGARTVVTGSGLDPYFLEQGVDDRALAERVVGGTFPFVLTVGQGSPRKNHVRAVQAFTRAFGAEEGMRYVLVRRLGRRDRAFERLIDDPSVRDRVIVIGQVRKDELRALYRTARCFFFPSLVEGFGLPIIEAMACRCPVVTSDIGAMSEVAGHAARLCSPTSVADMASALRDASLDGELRERLVAEGVARAASYDFRTCAERTLEVYHQLAP